MISNSGHDERGKYSGGTAGDQTGGEWSRIAWYNRPWTVVLRHPDPSVRGLIAQLAGEAADNPHIGYDQGERWTFWNHLKEAGYFPSAIQRNCEADCSAGVAAIVKAAGYILGLSRLQSVTPDMYTGVERRVLTSAGFADLTDSKYLTSDQYLLPGDILLYENHHTAINLSYGSKSDMKKITAESIVSACGSFYKIQRAGNYRYGDSHSLPPCADHVTSCERGAVARPLWDLGLHDQQAGGVTVLNMDRWLTAHHFQKITNPDKLKRGDIVLMKAVNTSGPTAAWHAFLLTDFKNQRNVSKYDFGSQERLRAPQPFVNVPLNQWPGSKVFYAAYRAPGESTPSDGPEKYGEDYWTYDETYYRTAAPDVVKKLGSSGKVLKDHYDSFGKKEGRSANCLLNPSYYRSKYKDLNAAFGSDWKKYIRHYSTYGIKEGRRGSVVFDPEYYRTKYPDLKKAFGREMWRYVRHFIQYGMKEGRQGSADFDPKVYRKRYKDLDKAFGNNWRLYYIHYLIYGIKEGRKGT